MLLLLLLIGGGSYAWGETKTAQFGPNWNELFGTSYKGAFKPEANKLNLLGTANSVGIVVVNGGSINGYVKTGDFRAYSGYTISFTAPEGCNITAITSTKGGRAFTNDKCVTADCGNLKIKNDAIRWTGSTNAVKLTISGTVTFNTVIVTYTTSGGDTPTTPSLNVNTTSVDFGKAFVGASVEPKNVTVTMANIEGGATAKFDKGEASPFAVTPESLSATGDVAVSPKAETLAAAGVYEDKLTITAGELTKTVDVKLTVAKKSIVTWNVNGKVYTEGAPTTEVVEGEKLSTLPTAPASIGGLVFMGWTNEAVTSQEAAPAVLFTSAADAPAVTADVTYYAVFASQSGSMKWKKVSLANVDEGIYALITPDGHAFNGKIASGHGQATVDAFIFDKSGVATSAPEGTLEVILSAKAGGYTMFNADKGYLYAKEAKSGNLDWDTKESGNWLYKEGQKEDNWLYDSNKAYLRCYKNTFRTYGYGAYDSISFVKKVSDISCSNYTTSAETLPLRAFDGKNHFATFSSDKAVKFVDATVYAVGVNDDRLILTEVESKQVPANTGVLLKSASTEATYSVIGSAPAIENNLLCASVEEGQTTAADGTTEGYSFFKLSYNQAGENEKLGFYWAKENGAPFVSKTGLAYLAVKTADVAAVKGFSLIDMETGISKVSGSAAGNGVIYDLQGRRVEHAVRGLYIVNGRKVMVK